MSLLNAFCCMPNSVRRIFLMSMLCGGLGILPAEVQGQELPTEGSVEPSESDEDNPLSGKIIVRVEEEWIVDIANPDPELDIPQIVTVFGPDDPQLGTHGIFEVNHSTVPDFVDGGMQLQCWFRDSRMGARRHLNPAELAIGIERIRYTTVVELKDSKLILEIKNGDSVTFGKFGGEGQLRLALWTWRHNLNSYNAQNSITHSRVSYGANRVNRFLRAGIRYYTSDGEVIVDETDTIIHQVADANLGPAPVNAPTE
ncbi:MAG: hypothetical protein R3C01_15765 [Planctomycetaceae bacterium]